MHIIRPTTITDAMLTSTDVVETDYAEFSMGTTYTPETIVMDSTGVEILTLDVAPATAWAPGDLVTGQSSGKTCRAVSKLTSLTYRIRERSGSFTPGEVIGVTGTPAKLADQGASFPTIAAATDKVHKIYESLPGSDLEVLTLDVSPAVPWIPGWTLTGKTSGQTCVVAAYQTALSYLVRNRSGNFTLGEVIGVTGTASLLADQGAANPTVAAAVNVGRYPADDLLLDTPLWWKEVSATNRWKVFDRKVGAQASKSSSMNFVLTPGLIDSIALLNLDATSVQIVVTDPVEGEVYNVTTNLISTIAVVDFYTYFFEPIVRATDVLKTDLAAIGLPPYLSASISVTITYAGGTAKCGEIVVGIKSEIGMLQNRPSAGITDYSSKTTDSMGNYTITERAYSKKLSCDLRIRNTIVDEVIRQLSVYRATPIVWVAAESYTFLIIYGFYKNFNVIMANSRFSTCSLDVEGLT